jgi:hypothetical protein
MSITEAGATEKIGTQVGTLEKARRCPPTDDREMT